MDLDAVDGIPCTGIERTQIDLASILSARRVEKVLERAEELRIFDLTRLESALARNRGRHGVRQLRLALSIYEPPPFSRSGLEDRFLELLNEAGLPKPTTGYNVAGYELDVYWFDLRFAVELGVFETHGRRLSFEDDALRQEELKLAGVESITVTGARLDREPDRVIERVATLLARRRRELRLGRRSDRA
jgi:very-short-patch-repair endonuclease